MEADAACGLPKEPASQKELGPQNRSGREVLEGREGCGAAGGFGAVDEEAEAGTCEVVKFEVELFVWAEGLEVAAFAG